MAVEHLDRELVKTRLAPDFIITTLVCHYFLYLIYPPAIDPLDAGLLFKLAIKNSSGTIADFKLYLNHLWTYPINFRF